MLCFCARFIQLVFYYRSVVISHAEKKMHEHKKGTRFLLFSISKLGCSAVLHAFVLCLLIVDTSTEADTFTRLFERGERSEGREGKGRVCYC